ncbi:hypothetical protein N431DRAFT_224445 [Stipitochalara longipes BDJ]|nr:hypothetical protein N431DRAFT_224445 [Stipitochalara longipes BDJ]
MCVKSKSQASLECRQPKGQPQANAHCVMSQAHKYDLKAHSCRSSIVKSPRPTSQHSSSEEELCGSVDRHAVLKAMPLDLKSLLLALEVSETTTVGRSSTTTSRSTASSIVESATSTTTSTCH